MKVTANAPKVSRENGWLSSMCLCNPPQPPCTEDWDMLDVDEDEKLTGEEEFELLAGPLGLSERRFVPEPVQFPDSDPLGASVAMVTATNSMEETLLQIGNFDDHPIPEVKVCWEITRMCSYSGCQTLVDKNSSGRVTLGEQAAAVKNPHDRIMALRRVTAAAQVLLARTMVMRALSLLSVRYSQPTHTCRPFNAATKYLVFLQISD